MTLELLHGIRDYTLTRTSIPNRVGNIKDITKYRIRLTVVLLIIQWSFKRFHFRYKHLKVLTEVAFLTCRGREFQMAAPEYMTCRTVRS